MKITDDRARDLLCWLDDMAGDHTLLFDEMARYRDAAALIRQLQAADGTKESLLRGAAVLVRELDAAEQAAWHAGLDAGREQGRGKDHAQQPPSAPEAQGGGEVEYEFEVWQNDSLQAGGSTSDYATAKSEAEHYAFMYGQDGPVEVRMYVKRQIAPPPGALVGVVEAFEEYHKADHRDPAVAPEWEWWKAGWKAALAQQPAACAHSWHDYGTVNRAWCSRCNAVAVIGHEDRPYGVLSVTDDGEYRTDSIQQPAAVEAKDAEIETLKAEVAAQRTRADAMAGEAIKHEARADRLAEALRMIAAPQRPDVTWSRDREACRQVAEQALRGCEQEVDNG